MVAIPEIAIGYTGGCYTGDDPRYRKWLLLPGMTLPELTLPELTLPEMTSITGNDTAHTGNDLNTGNDLHYRK